MEIKLTNNALMVLRKRYLAKDEHGNVVETPGQMFRRVAHAIAQAEKRYGGDASKMEEAFLRLMVNLEFLCVPRFVTGQNDITHFYQTVNDLQTFLCSEIHSD